MKIRDFNCRCGQCGKGFYDMNSELISELINIDHSLASSLVITSAIRCRKHNLDIGGSETSAHLKGDAVDLLCESGSLRFKIVEFALFYRFKRIGIYPTYIHLDISEAPNHQQDTIWVGK